MAEGRIPDIGKAIPSGFQPAPYREVAEGDDKGGRAAMFRQMEELRASGATHADGSPVAPYEPTPDPVYAPQKMTRAQMVAMIGEEALARTEFAEGVTILEDGTKVPRAEPMAENPNDVLSLPSEEPARTDDTYAGIVARHGQWDPAAPDPDPTGVVLTVSDTGPLRKPRTGRQRAVSPGTTGTAAGGQDVLPGTADPGPPEPPAPRLTASEVEDRVARAAQAERDRIAAEARAAEVVHSPRRDDPTEPGRHVVAGPPQKRQPAASDTDSPATGLLADIGRPSTASGLPITGGFGDAAGDQYFPLNGWELRTVAEAIWSRLHERLKDDLRFSMAATYPRATVTLTLKVEGYAVPDVEVAVPWRAVPKSPGATPESVAQELAGEMVFVTTETLSEQGDEPVAPNALRQGFGLPVPRKTRVATGKGFTWTDLPGGHAQG